jgi:hypothetical protein
MLGAQRCRRGGSCRIIAWWGACVLAAMIATTAIAGNALAATAHSRALIPFCRASAPRTNPHPDCLFQPYAYPAQAAKFNGTATVIKAPKRIRKTWNYEFTVKLHYSVPYSTLCPPSGANPADFPCQQEGYDDYGDPNVQFEILGAYVPHKKTLEDISPIAQPHQDCPNLSGTCIETFLMNAYSQWGRFDFDVSMGLSYYVPYSWDGNIDGGGGFETAISVNFPKLKGSSPKKITPP